MGDERLPRDRPAPARVEVAIRIGSRETYARGSARSLALLVANSIASTGTSRCAKESPAGAIGLHLGALNAVMLQPSLD